MFDVKKYFIIDTSDISVVAYFYDYEKFILQYSNNGKIEFRWLKKFLFFSMLKNYRNNSFI